MMQLLESAFDLNMPSLLLVEYRIMDENVFIREV
jgi:hypothetical protein